ncbi:hypothetical protein PFDSM3638_02945 [Pyrococcus furiosus DSM 3638]|uniref:Uncharacterized protein n=3 Tax=Pyrococcus furiosus TaxID=2261 RepID=Q8U384_PYRFU|nr:MULTISPECIES: hypothetical protein [Pyrococcus]AAL80711.1 hypothetical protein PF0587 [Pyrococcus furiosus DSM 3638]AFN03380.1 hypothetical protein PFC_02065 [Pyrococcus furiosus COM1]MDK2870322.1 hypothetical protein [Pyrococcus sp.]QEK78293.1 hypothetical protein PFDSM3638_02945 [Pyrococcus furiosus DSM 3638]
MIRHAVVFFFLLLIGAFVFSRAIKTVEVQVLVYYPGELVSRGYRIEGGQVILKFHALNRSEELKVKYETFKVRCFFCDLDLENATIIIDGTPLKPTCKDYIMSFDTGDGMLYIASPYNLSETAEIWIPEGYQFKELKFENNTLVILVSPGDGEKVKIIHSGVVAEHREGLEKGWVKVIYTDGSKSWGGRVYSFGEGECPILIKT